MRPDDDELDFTDDTVSGHPSDRRGERRPPNAPGLSQEDWDELAILLRTSRKTRSAWVTIVSFFVAVGAVIGTLFGGVQIWEWLKSHFKFTVL